MMNAMMKMWGSVQTRIVREDGATMVEYAIMVALIAAVSMLAITALGIKVGALFDSVNF
jgi:pilus assembly protein Flp/PilA